MLGLSLHFGMRSFPTYLMFDDTAPFGFHREDPDTLLWLGPVGLCIYGKPEPSVVKHWDDNAFRQEHDRLVAFVSSLPAARPSCDGMLHAAE